ncbi:MAG TPA: formate dehydrogenase accessory sulfurtransferase FdhD [Stellaceae bacterium]|jgi:FdhD protein|nr:formate dehydrogenase accessory sulfurtransferase FdhD [Stellaceae bacterium]
MEPASQRLKRRQWRFAAAAESLGTRAVATEVPIAFTYRGCSYAVMMATPADLDDFARGFTLSEGLISSAQDVSAIDVRTREEGIVLDIDLAATAMDRFWERRRFLAGPSGCGLCGIESLKEALRPIPRVTGTRCFAPDDIAAALTALPACQSLGRETRAVHAAALWRPEDGTLTLREDIGRHNALDKLIGATMQENLPLGEGILLLTSRLSVELIQKAVIAGAGMVVGVSAPTALAVRTAETAGITLIGIARDDGFEIFTDAGHLTTAPSADAA